MPGGVVSNLGTMFERIVNMATLILLLILVVQVTHVTRYLRRIEHEQRGLLREQHLSLRFDTHRLLVKPFALSPRLAGEGPSMSNDPEYWAFMQNLLRARTLACREQGIAIVNALRSRGIQATVGGAERDDLARPRVVISIGIFEPTPITRSLVNSLPKQIAGFPVVVERPGAQFACGFQTLEARSPNHESIHVQDLGLKPLKQAPHQESVHTPTVTK